MSAPEVAIRRCSKPEKNSAIRIVRSNGPLSPPRKAGSRASDGSRSPESRFRGNDPRLLGLLGRALQLDGVAVGIGDIDRRAVALGAIAPPDLAGIDAVALQMRGQCRHV